MVWFVPLSGHCLCYFFQAIPVPGYNNSLPLHKSTESCESLLQAEWQQITLVTLVFVKQILLVDHNLEYLEFEDPLD